MIVKAHEVSVACATSSIRTPWKLKPDSFTWKDGWWHISATFVPRLPWFNPCDPQTIDGGDWIPMTSYKWPNLICAFARTLNVSNRRSPVVFQRQQRFGSTTTTVAKVLIHSGWWWPQRWNSCRLDCRGVYSKSKLWGLRSLRSVVFLYPLVN